MIIVLGQIILATGFLQCTYLGPYYVLLNYIYFRGTYHKRNVHFFSIILISF